MSCLFNSLNKGLELHNIKLDKDLRRYLVKFMKTDPIIYEHEGKNIKLSDEAYWESGLKEEEEFCYNCYLKNMKQESVMGGAIEIKAFVILFNINVIVNNLIKFDSKDGKKNIYLHYSNMHYEFINIY